MISSHEPISRRYPVASALIFPREHRDARLSGVRDRGLPHGLIKFQISGANGDRSSGRDFPPDVSHRIVRRVSRKNTLESGWDPVRFFIKFPRVLVRSIMLENVRSRVGNLYLTLNEIYIYTSTFRIISLFPLIRARVCV